MSAAIAHGGRLLAASLRHPGAPTPWIDLSTGINPIAYPVPELPPEVFTRLPEPEAVMRLEAVAARTYGVSESALVVAAPGTQMLIHLLPRLVAAGHAAAPSVAVLGPTYAEHAASWRLAGRAVAEVESLEAARLADIAVLCNPNNPDGRAYPPEALLADARRRHAAGGMLVVDEAFADLDGVSLAPALPCGGLLVLRSFGKTYGLAGIRLGFALCDAALAERMRAAMGPWAVSGPALHIGARALADRDWLRRTAARLAGDARRLDALVAAHGGAIVGGTRLFRLVRFGRAAALCHRLGEAGILVRSFADRPDWLRFGMPGDEDAWARLAAALATRQ